MFKLDLEKAEEPEIKLPTLLGLATNLATSLQTPQEAGKVVWYSHLLKNFPQFVVIHTVEGFDIVNKAEVDVFLEFSCFFYD